VGHSEITLKITHEEYQGCPKLAGPGLGPVWGLPSGLPMVVQLGVYASRTSRIGGGMVVQRWAGVVLWRSSSRFIDHLCPDALGLENELDGFADCAMPGEVLGNVVRGFFHFGDGIAYGNGEADTAH